MTCGSVEFLLRLLDADEPAAVSQDGFDGEFGPSLRLWQRMGFLSEEPGSNPVPSCPHCDGGTPYPLEDRRVCNGCRSVIDPRDLLLWPLDGDAFLRWIAGELRLRGGVRRVDARLWQLGTWEGEGGPLECFYHARGEVSDLGRARLEAFRNVLVFFGVPRLPGGEQVAARRVYLAELLRLGDALTVSDLSLLLRPHGIVRFDPASGTLWAGDAPLGEVPAGSKEFSFLACLARHLDRHVPYADLKREVLERSGSTDSRDEASFCHRLKSRIKQKFIPQIDRYLVTANKGEGYRLRAWGEPG